MDGLLTEIKSVKKVQNNIDKFESLSLEDVRGSSSNNIKSKRPVAEISALEPIEYDKGESDNVKHTKSNLLPTPVQPASKKHKRHESTAFLQKSYLHQSGPSSLPDDAREILRNQPDQEDLMAVMLYLEYGIKRKHDLNIHLLGPKASQILNILVTVTIPDQWHVLRQKRLSSNDMQLKTLFIHALRSVAGIGALLMQIKSLASRKASQLLLEDTLSVLSSVLDESQFLWALLQDGVVLYPKESHMRIFWQETVALLCGSKVFSTVSQAIGTSSDLNVTESEWLCNGNQYSAWLARNVSHCALRLDTSQTELWIMLSQAMKRAMSLGYRDDFIRTLYSSLLLGSRALWMPLQQLLKLLSSHEQRVFFDGVLFDLARTYLPISPVQVDGLDTNPKNDRAIGGVAVLISKLVENNPILEEHVESWLSDTTGEYATVGLHARRAVITTLAIHQHKLQKVLDRSLETFGDKLYIQHAPILQQQAMADTIILAVAYLYRVDKESVRKLAKTGMFLMCVSTRLASSVPRIRLLGMIVAVAVSRLIDASDKVMDFGTDEMDSDFAKSRLALVNIHDEVGDLDDLKNLETPIKPPSAPAVEPVRSRNKPIKPFEPQIPTSKIIAIEELSLSSESEDDLQPYAKPDSDASDSEDDPTLINRSKPSAPVYITTLLSQLNTSDKPEITELALRTAPDLIRRKASFGTELSENVQAVASSLLNLKDGMDEPDLQNLRLQSLIACVVTQPRIIAPWLCSTYFEGDYSLTQRATLLSVLGLGARELSGHKDSTTPTDLFPSKRLPPHLATIYQPLNSTSQQITHSTLQPLAFAAADKLSGPDILKIRTFSSRLDVQRRTAATAEQRSKRIPKDLHVLLSHSIYLPLCLRMTLLLTATATSTSTSTSHPATSTRSTLFDPTILRLFLQTLTITLHCLGPNALQLQDITRETLQMLIALHNSVGLAYDPVVLPALCQLLLTTIDLSVSAGVTAEERLVTEFGGMVAELVGWVGGLVEGREGEVGVPVLSGSEDQSEGGMPWTVLVAGIQVKWGEVGRKFQGKMMGLMGGEMDF